MWIYNRNSSGQAAQKFHCSSDLNLINLEKILLTAFVNLAFIFAFQKLVIKIELKELKDFSPTLSVTRCEHSWTESTNCPPKSLTTWKVKMYVTISWELCLIQLHGHGVHLPVLDFFSISWKKWNIIFFFTCTVPPVIFYVHVYVSLIHVKKNLINYTYNNN